MKTTLDQQIEEAKKHLAALENKREYERLRKEYEYATGLLLKTDFTLKSVVDNGLTRYTATVSVGSLPHLYDNTFYEPLGKTMIYNGVLEDKYVYDDLKKRTQEVKIEEQKIAKENGSQPKPQP